MADSKGDAIMGGHFATNSLENPLWKYACQVYSQQGVEAALLELQDEHGADINLILQALWLAGEGKQWSRERIAKDYDKWMKDQVLPLRQIRRGMKVEWPNQEDFRLQVKKLELKAEQIALWMLFVSSDNVNKQEEGPVISNSTLDLRLNVTLVAEYLKIPQEKFQQLISII